MRYGQSSAIYGEQSVNGGAYVISCTNAPRANLPSEKVVEDLDDILASLELEASDVRNKVMEEVGAISLLR
jgi:hypothetical protein